MKDIWTKVAAILTTVAGGLLLTTGALAVEAGNSNTGADSTNNANVTIQNNTTINSTNNANINNTLNIYANTGNNSASENTGDGSVKTGDITGSVSILNTGNMNEVIESNIGLNCNGNCEFTATNHKTGADSTNNANVDIQNNVNISVRNDANVDNNIDADLNTGGNNADENTGDGSVSTGDIDFNVEIVNDLNNNFIGGPVDGGKPQGPGVPPGVLPGPAPKPGQVLAASEGLPITGSSLPNWPLLLLAVGIALKLFELVSKKRTEEVV